MRIKKNKIEFEYERIKIYDLKEGDVFIDKGDMDLVVLKRIKSTFIHGHKVFLCDYFNWKKHGIMYYKSFALQREVLRLKLD
jgi:hypothetical protein